MNNEMALNPTDLNLGGALEAERGHFCIKNRSESVVQRTPELVKSGNTKGFLTH